MYKNSFFEILLFAFTLFGMIFGSGNITYPILTGNLAAASPFFAIVAFLISSAFLAFAGFWAVSRYRGDYELFLNKNLPSFSGYEVPLLIFIGMLMLGPLGCIPRCSIVAFGAWPSLPISQELFSLGFLFTTFLVALDRGSLIRFLGKFLAPATFAIFCFIIVASWFVSPVFAVVNTPASLAGLSNIFGNSLYYGYFPFDLLAVLFYAKVFFRLLTQQAPERINDRRFLVSVGAVSTAIFSFIYSGMIYLAAKFSQGLPLNVSSEKLFLSYVVSILGPSLAILASIVVSLGCFCTTVALLIVFADYLEEKFFSKNKYSYFSALLLTVLISGFCSVFGFSGVEFVTYRLMMVGYPFLIFATIREVFRWLCVQ